MLLQIRDTPALRNGANPMFRIKISFDCTRNDARVGGTCEIENRTPVGPNKGQAMALAQQQLAHRIEERYDVSDVLITDLQDVA